jgi:hypothetical protein
MKTRVGVIFLVMILTLALGTTGVLAAVWFVDGDIELITSPTSVVAGYLQSDDYIRVFDENQNVFLTDNLTTDDFRDTIDAQTIPAGTFVNSHLVHFDPTASMQLSGTITFYGDILGLFPTNDGLSNTDGIFGLSSTKYPTGSDTRKSDEGGSNQDVITYTDNQLTITLKAADKIDQIRVITEGTGTIEDIDIDIKPESDPNSINIGSKGVIPIAILGSAGFDASTVNPLTITAVKVKGKSGNAGSLEDINNDGYLDLVVHVYTQGLGLSSGDTEATIWGLTYGGTAVGGSDSIRIVPPQ